MFKDTSRRWLKIASYFLFLFLSVRIGSNMENPSATTASFGSFATWKHCIRWSRGIQDFCASDKNEVKLASGQIVTELRGECGSGQEREGENNWFRTSWELCLNLQPHALHINSYNSYRELYTCQADRWSTCKHWHGHAAACACACARRTCWAHVPRTLINVSGMWSG